MYVGMRVTIGDLKSRPELNGTVGTALSFEQSRSRYAVQIASGERIALKATNLSLAPDEPEAEPTPEDDGAELLECARYGEEDELRQLLAKGVPPGFADAQGTTALHRAAANGHLACVRALAAAGCPHVANSSGNVPLHWAVQQGHVGVTRALLELYSDIDVLAQNEFGKSISSEAFAKGDPALVELLLEHASAAKLEPSGASDGAGAGADGAGTATMEGEATHGFRFLDDAESALVHVRELGELGADDPSQANARILGAGADDDRTGLQLWAASIVLARWLVQLTPHLRGRGVVELGAGCGLCGITAAKLCGATPVTITDLNAPTMENLEHNLALNELAPPHACAAILDWRDTATWPDPQPLVIGADLIYADEAVAPLTTAVEGLVTPGGAFLYVAPETNRQGETAFLSGLVARGWECQRSEVPPSFLSNCVHDATDEEFEMLFSELKVRTYTLYCFSRMGELAAPQLSVPDARRIGTDVRLSVRAASGGERVSLQLSVRPKEEGVVLLS